MWEASDLTFSDAIRKKIDIPYESEISDIIKSATFLVSVQLKSKQYTNYTSEHPT